MPPGLDVRDFYYLLPELVITAGALVVLIADVLLPRRNHALSWIALLVLAATMASLLRFSGTHREIANGLIAVDWFALFFKIVFIFAAIVTVLLSLPCLDIEGASPGEYFFLIQRVTLGIMVMAA